MYKRQVADKFVGGVGKETLQAAEEGIGLSGFYLTYKLLYLERCLYQMCIRDRFNPNARAGSSLQACLQPLHARATV